MKLYAFLALLCLAACGDDAIHPPPIAELMKPETCKECHAEHYNQWAGSMHAYAADDPVFVAMNNRGQRDTGDKLGTFCVSCHAPMAVKLGLTDGRNFDPTTLPPEARGVTCYFCHNVEAVTDTHNNGLTLAMDQTMRGGVRDPVKSPAHFSKYDELMDSDRNNSEMCGSCHDIVVPQELNGVAGGVAVERTFAEWKQTFFATESDPGIHLSCGACHMPGDPNPRVLADAAGLTVPARRNAFHEHAWPAIDQALTPWPGIDEQAALIKRELDGAVRVVGPFNVIAQTQPGGICIEENLLKIRLDTISPGHAFPSGAAHDRRAWLEVIAKNAAGDVIFSSGVVPEDADPPDDPFVESNPVSIGLWDRTFKSDGAPAHFFWEIAEVRSHLMKVPTVRGEDHSYNFKWQLPNLNEIDRVETRLLIRALPFAVLDDLEASGDLDPAVRGQLKLLTVEGGRSVWTKATKGMGDAINTGCNPN
ncbi:MAG: hypothetical protein KF773_41570 [Deltaproteobacteria bacterium]|nr:hypothetical protein [Deltaproteobacteria bacterium]